MTAAPECKEMGCKATVSCIISLSTYCLALEINLTARLVPSVLCVRRSARICVSEVQCFTVYFARGIEARVCTNKVSFLVCMCACIPVFMRGCPRVYISAALEHGYVCLSPTHKNICIHKHKHTFIYTGMLLRRLSDITCLTLRDI